MSDALVLGTSGLCKLLSLLSLRLYLHTMPARFENGEKFDDSDI